MRVESPPRIARRNGIWGAHAPSPSRIFVFSEGIAARRRNEHAGARALPIQDCHFVADGALKFHAPYEKFLCRFALGD
ncbi:MAG: hypothetical protein DME45_04700 [Verrucomicrobia bacterium]|nr:MAG: hypothetical protein DME45_04700 [Verrucomicrobiota bacterium]